MRLFAKKPCNFGGKKYFVGDEIPATAVANPKAQEKMGVIAISNGGTVPPEELQEMVAQVGVVKFEIPVHTEDGDLILSVTNEELQVFTDIRQIDVQKTEDKQQIAELIQKVESEDLLILLDALDGRKFVKTEAQARAKALSDAESEQENEKSEQENEEGEPEQTGGDE